MKKVFVQNDFRNEKNRGIKVLVAIWLDELLFISEIHFSHLPTS